jgi:hypothetical protein
VFGEQIKPKIIKLTKPVIKQNIPLRSSNTNKNTIFHNDIITNNDYIPHKR